MWFWSCTLWLFYNCLLVFSTRRRKCLIAFHYIHDSNSHQTIYISMNIINISIICSKQYAFFSPVTSLIKKIMCYVLRKVIFMHGSTLNGWHSCNANQIQKLTIQSCALCSWDDIRSWCADFPCHWQLCITANGSRLDSVKPF